MKILIINGPNLNLLGTREPEIYGHETMDDVMADLRRQFPDDEIDYFQSNWEGAIIDRLQDAAYDDTEGIVLNAAGYTHTSVAIADAIAAISVPVIEVHISNVAAREDFRRHSMIAPYCAGTIAGFGTRVYTLAVSAFTQP